MLDEGSLRLGTVEKGLQNVHLWRVVVSVQLLVVAMLVSEHAAGTVHARPRVVEGPAVLALELVVVDAAGSLCELLLSVGKTTLALISALGSLNPILAELSLILAISIVLDHLWLLLEALSRVERLLLASVGIHALVSVESSLLAVVERLRIDCEALKVGGLEGGAGWHK